MPKTKALGLYAEKDIDFTSAIKGCIKRSRKSPDDIAKKALIAKSTYYNHLRHPGNMTINELRTYIREINIPEDDILNALYLNKKEE